jgi:hypothetical protein
MAANKISIKFDIDKKDLEIVTGKVLTLQQQIKILKQEIQKPGYSPAELDALRKKLGDTEDAFKATKAKSGDLLTSLQLIPGPIGEIASKVNGAISILKQFGSFKIEDLKFQIKETIDDFKDVIKTIGQATGITKLYTTASNALASAFVKVGVGEAAATAGAKAFSAALISTGIGALVVALGLAVQGLMDFASGSDEAEKQQKQLNDELERSNMLLDMDLASAKRRQAERIASLKSQGANEKTIRAQGIKDLKEQLSLTQTAIGENIEKERQLQKEGKKGLEDVYKQRNKLEGQQKDLISQIKIAELDNITETNKQIKTQNEQAVQNTIKSNEKLNKAEADRLAQQKADAAERRRLTDESIKLFQEEKKAEEERVSGRKDFAKSIRDLYVSLITDENARRRAEIKNAQKDELEALEKDKNFLELSETEKARIRYAVREKNSNEINDLNKKSKDKQTKDDEEAANAQIAIEQKKFDAQQKLLGATASAITALADIVGKNTLAGKALAVAASLINTYTAIAGSLAQYSKPGAPPIPGFAIAQAVATGLVGFKAVADIIKTPVPNSSTGGGAPEQPRKLASGGMVSGRGGPKSDLIPAMLSNGESVINAQSTAMFKPLLSSINAIGGGRRFADGGLAVGSFSQQQALSDLQSSMNLQATPIKTYVVASDMTSQQMMDRSIKSRSTI